MNQPASEDQVVLFRELLQHTQDMIYVADARTGRILDANESAARNLEYSREELLRLSVPDFSVRASQQPWELRYEFIKASGTVTTEGLFRTRTGRIFPVEVSLRYVEHAGAGYITGVSRDITERRRQAEHIDRLTRILRMQSGINAAVLRIQNQDELLQEACRLATEVGGYDRAVLSMVDPSGKFAVPRYRAGRGTDFPEPERLAIADDPALDTNLSGRALRTGKIAVNSDISRSGPAVNMREQLLALGYKAAAALPLIVDGRRVAALILTTRDANLVADNELLILLQDMMASLSFALRSREHAEAAQYLAYYDPLTGLAKRSLFLENLRRFIDSESRPNREFSVIVFDIRGLNRINDTYGRHFGDLTLLRVAERLRSYAASDADIAHLGSGAFALVERPLSKGDESIRTVLDSSLFAESFDIDGQNLRLSCSYGIAHFPGDGTDAGGLLQRAEAALKQAKESGEQYLHYRLDMHSRMAEQLELEHKLSSAVASGEFELYYQPQINLRTGRIEGIEGLLRWNDPASGIVLPQRFLPTLESTGMILVVGEWVLNTAVEDCIRWHGLGVAPLRVAVNVSAVQLRQRSFVPQILECCKRLEACPGYGLDIEITESLLLQDLEGTERKLRELRAAGVRVALDDFGTGYSALGLLSKLPVDLLKIDRSFVKGLPHDAPSVLLVETILRLASSLKLITVVEGVETEAQLEAIRAMRCDVWQGFLHSRPTTAAALTGLLRGN
jgi:diguanylate cyclase (GGDEF)-like protein/PAS domain S-box-containing protein